MGGGEDGRLLFDLHHLESGPCYVVYLCLIGAPREYDCVLMANGVTFTFGEPPVRSLSFSDCDEAHKSFLEDFASKDDNEIPVEKRNVLTLHRTDEAKIFVQCPKWIDWEQLVPGGRRPSLTMRAYAPSEGKYELVVRCFPLG